MNTPSPLTPQGTTPETRRRHMTAFFVILSLHVVVLGMFLMVQGCKPETEQPKPQSETGAPGLVSETTPPVGGNPSTMGDPLPTNPNANPVGTPGPGVTPPPAGVPTGAAPLGNDPALAGGHSAGTPGGVGAPTGGAGVGTLPPPVVTPSISTPSVLPPPVAADPAPVTTPGSEHTVLKGETLAVIAKQYHMGWKAIAAANPGVDPTKLKVGQKLVIPARTVTAATDVSAGAPAPLVGDAPVASKTYTVKSGDNLAKIAKSHGVTLKALKAANGLKLDRITVGQKLKIPSKPSTAPSTPVAPPPSIPVVPEPVPTIPVPSPTTPGALTPPVLPPAGGGAPVRTP